MGEPKKHHYIPKFLLENFSDENGILHFFTKENKDNKVLKSKPEKLFKEKFLYSISREDGSKDNTLEKKYSRMETQAADLINKIIEQVRLDKAPILSDQELKLWIKFFFNQWKRVPDMHNGYFSDEKVFQALADTPYAQNNPAEHDQLISELKNDPKIKKEFIQTMKVSALGYDSGRIEKAFEGTGLGILRIKKSNKSYLIGSHPIVNLADKNLYVIKKGNQIWLPVSYDIAICSTISADKQCVVYEPNDNHVRLMNEMTYKNSTMIAGKSKKLVKSIIRKTK